MAELTELERQYLEAKRNGLEAKAATTQVGGGELVTLKLTERAQAEEPVQAPPQERTQVRSLGDLTTADFLKLAGEGPKPAAATETAAVAAPLPIKEEEEVAQPDPVEAPAEHPTFCKQCGWDQSKEIAFTPTDADKEEFIKSILGSRPFHRVVTRLGGKVEILYATPTLEDEDRIWLQLKAEERAEVITTPQEWWAKAKRYRAVLMLREIRHGADILQFPTDHETALDELVKTRLAGRPAHMISLILGGLDEVDGVYGTLSKRAGDANFWNGSAE